MKLVQIQLAMTESELCALMDIKRGMVKGWGFPDHVGGDMRANLCARGLITALETLTHAGELVISATGLESVVMQ